MTTKLENDLIFLTARDKEFQSLGPDRVLPGIFRMYLLRANH